MSAPQTHSSNERTQRTSCHAHTHSRAGHQPAPRGRATDARERKQRTKCNWVQVAKSALMLFCAVPSQNRNVLLLHSFDETHFIDGMCGWCAARRGNGLVLGWGGSSLLPRPMFHSHAYINNIHACICIAYRFCNGGCAVSHTHTNIRRVENEAAGTSVVSHVKSVLDGCYTIPIGRVCAAFAHC